MSLFFGIRYVLNIAERFYLVPAYARRFKKALCIKRNVIFCSNRPNASTLRVAVLPTHGAALSQYLFEKKHILFFSSADHSFSLLRELFACERRLRRITRKDSFHILFFRFRGHKTDKRNNNKSDQHRNTRVYRRRENGEINVVPVNVQIRFAVIIPTPRAKERPKRFAFCGLFSNKANKETGQGTRPQAHPTKLHQLCDERNLKFGICLNDL